MLSAAVLLSIAGGCSGNEPTTTESNSTVAVETTVAATTVAANTPVETPAADLPAVNLPPVDDDLRTTVRAELAEQVVSDWLDSVVEGPPDLDDPCGSTIELMSAETATAAISVSDDVTAEMMLNLDGALGGVSAACVTGNAAAAKAEALDAMNLIAAIQQRLGEIGL